MDLKQVLSNLNEFVVDNIDLHIDDQHISKRILACDLTNLGTNVFIFQDQCHMVTMCFLLRLTMRINNSDNISNTSKNIFNKTSTQRDVNDLQLSFNSNANYIEIDCEPWTHMERRSLPDLIYSLTCNSSVLNMKHIIIIRNIDLLLPSQLLQLKRILEGTAQQTIFLITTTNLSYAQKYLGTISMSICIKVGYKTLLQAYSKTLNRCETDNINLNCTAQTFVSCILLLNGFPKPNSSVDDFIHTQLNLMIEKSAVNDITGAYDTLSNFVNILMSSDVPVPVILNACISYAAQRQNDSVTFEVVKILADMDATIKQQNKPHFGLEFGLFKFIKRLGGEESLLAL